MTSALRILIVDDDPGDRELEKLALSEQSFACQIESVDSAEAALARLTASDSATDIDVILLDGHLGEKSATWVIDAVRARPHLRDIHIVVLTGSHNPLEHSEYLGHGAAQVLEKGTQYDDLINTLAQLHQYVTTA